MLQPILGTLTCERVLMFLFARNEGYAREIARFFNENLSSVQNQLEKLENGGVLAARRVGRTLVYSFNPTYPFLTELKKMLEKALSFYPPAERENLTIYRQRPRRTRKPL